MRFDKYEYLTDQFTRIYRKFKGLSKGVNVYKDIIQSVISARNQYLPGSLEPAVLLDEFMLAYGDHRVILPESTGILDMLMGSKFQMDHEINLETPFSEFVLMIPKGYEVDGVPMKSCIVTYCSPTERQAMFAKMRKLNGIDPGIILDNGEKINSSEKSLFIGFNSISTKGAYVRCSIPKHLINVVMKAEPENLYDVLPRYPGDFTMEMSDIEKKQQILTTKLICALSVFAKCRPQYLCTLPAELNSTVSLSDTSAQYLPGGNPDFSVLKDVPGRGGSKSVHYRTWYFRSYPTKKDGLKKDGWVFVNDTMVNEDDKPEFVHLKEPKE